MPEHTDGSLRRGRRIPADSAARKKRNARYIHGDIFTHRAEIESEECVSLLLRWGRVTRADPHAGA